MLDCLSIIGVDKLNKKLTLNLFVTSSRNLSVFSLQVY